MHIALMCATRRGRLVLEKLIELIPEVEFSVFSFREDPWEPPFFDEIKETTIAKGGNFFETRNVGSQSLSDFWVSAKVDLAFVVSWRYMIPAKVYSLPRLGTFVFHDSMLPTYRGFSPTVWSIINGEDHTGVSLFKIAEEVDSGDILDQERVPIGPEETISTIVERVTQTYLYVLEKNIDRLLDGTYSVTEQDHSKATYTCKRNPEDNLINWKAASEDVYNFIRALSQPYPGAYTFHKGEKLRVWSAERFQFPEFEGRIPGRVVQVIPGKGSVVLTRDGGILITEVQIEEGEVVCAAEIVNQLSHTLMQ